MRPARVPPIALISLVLAACGAEPAMDGGGAPADVPSPAQGTRQAADPQNESPSDATPPRSAPRRTKIGAMRSLTIVSDVEFEGFPDRPHRLDFICAFPARSRMELADASGAQVRYQFGERLWALDRPSRPVLGDEGTPPGSIELEGAASAALALEFAARRALYLWPDEGRFEGDGLTRTAAAPGRHGVLVATLHPTTGRPIDVRGFDADGRCAVQLVAEEWFEVEGRTWPQRVRLVDGDATVWTETTRSVDGSWFHGDAAFVPPEERVREVGSAMNTLIVRELPHAFVLELPLAAGDLPPASADARAAFEAATALAVQRWGELETHLAGTVVSLSAGAAVGLDARGTPATLRFDAPSAADGQPPPPFLGVAWTLRPPTFLWRLRLDAEFPDAMALDRIQRQASESDGCGADDVDVSLRIAVERRGDGAPTRGPGPAVLLGRCAPPGPDRRNATGESGADSAYDSLEGETQEPLEFVPPSALPPSAPAPAPGGTPSPAVSPAASTAGDDRPR